jgi:hypothetical protein
MDGGLMYFAKVFTTSGMPDEIWEIIYETQNYVKHGFAPYTVSRYVKEAASNPDDYSEVTEMIKLDEWFKTNGAREDETVLIEHC